MPSGRPYVMFAIPERFGASNYLRPIENDVIDVLATECKQRDKPCDDTAYELFNIIMEENGWQHDTTADGCFELYHKLREQILSQI